MKRCLSRRVEDYLETVMVKMDQQNETVTDEALAKEAARGDRAAFDQIVRRYTRLLIQFVVGRTGCYQDAEDIVQETFLRSYQHIGSFDGRYSLKNWLYTIAYRVTVSMYRKKQPLALPQEAMREMTDVTADAKPQGGGIWAVVRAMKPDDRTALWLRYKQDMDIQQIAAIMGKSQAGVRVHLHRARNRLAKKIAVNKESAAVCEYDVNGTGLMERV